MARKTTRIYKSINRAASRLYGAYFYNQEPKEPNMNKTTDNITLLRGDCLEILPTIEDNSADAVICDLPFYVFLHRLQYRQLPEYTLCKIAFLTDIFYQ